MYRILSLDGGGLRGVVTAKLLERLETAHPGFLSQVDLFAGTSTGGVLALGLARGLSPTDMGKLYTEAAEKVFAEDGVTPTLDTEALEDARGGLGGRLVYAEVVHDDELFVPHESAQSAAQGGSPHLLRHIFGVLTRAGAKGFTTTDKNRC